MSKLTPTAALSRLREFFEYEGDDLVQYVEDFCMGQRDELIALRARPVEGIERMRDYHQARGDQFIDGLTDATAAMRRAQEDLRDRSTTGDIVGLRALVIRVAGDLRTAENEATEAMREPEQPRLDE